MKTLRRNRGSFDKIVRVYAFQPTLGRIVAKLVDYYGGEYIDSLDLAEIELIEDDKAGTRHDPRPLVEQVAREIVGPKE